MKTLIFTVFLFLLIYNVYAQSNDINKKRIPNVFLALIDTTSTLINTENLYPNGKPAEAFPVVAVGSGIYKEV